MNVPPEVVEVLRQWVRKAEHDLEAASRIMAIEEGCPFDTGIQAPRTHDLKALAVLIPLEQCFPVRVEDLAELNPYAVNVRYADDWREPQLNDAKRALALASNVRAAVRESMPPPVID